MDPVIHGVVLTKLLVVNHPKGDIYRAMKATDAGYDGFGEAYFSTVAKDSIKGWKKHLRMVLNLVVPCGEVEFVLVDDRGDSPTFGQRQRVCLSPDNYCRLTVPPGIFMAFRGVGSGLNLVLNMASIEHDPQEAVNRDLAEMDFFS